MSLQAEATSTERPHPHQKLIKSCASCHARKVKCDAPTRGLPCSRCIGKGETCLLKGRQPRRMRPKNVLVTEFRHAPMASASPQLPDLTDSPHSAQSSQPPANSSPHLTPNLHSGSQGPSSNAAIDSPKTVVPSGDTPWKALNYNNGIHYLSILNEAVGRDAAEPGELKAATPQDQATKPSTSTEGLDPIDMEYLSRKGVFDLPPQPYLNKLLRLYFEFVYPFAPALNRCQFMSDYREGCYSIFLMQAVLTSAVTHAPEQVIQACGFSSSSEAQQSFFARATLLSDFGCEKSQLHLLQGSLILGTAMVPHAKDKDIHFWFYNSVRLALGMELHKCHNSQETDSEKSKLFKRIWWILYARDIVLSLFGTQNIRLLGDKEYDVSPFTEQDWEVEHLSEQDLVVLPVALPQHRLFFIEYCRMAITGWHCFSAVKDHREDPEVLTQRIASWRLSLPEILVHDRQTPDNIWSTVLLAISYRFECILLRLLRVWWRPRNTFWYEWTRKKLHSAMFELDTITGRTWSNGMLPTLPISFKSCIHTALAIHIEVALDESESEVNKAMSLLSIQRGMLLLKQLKEDPVLQQAIPLFEKILVQKNLISCVSTVQDQARRSDSVVGNQNNAVSLSNMQLDMASTAVPMQEPLLGDYGLWFKDFLGFDFLDT